MEGGPEWAVEEESAEWQGGTTPSSRGWRDTTSPPGPGPADGDLQWRGEDIHAPPLTPCHPGAMRLPLGMALGMALVLLLAWGAEGARLAPPPPGTDCRFWSPSSPPPLASLEGMVDSPVVFYWWDAAKARCLPCTICWCLPCTFCWCLPCTFCWCRVTAILIFYRKTANR